MEAATRNTIIITVITLISSWLQFWLRRPAKAKPRVKPVKNQPKAKSQPGIAPSGHITFRTWVRARWKPLVTDLLTFFLATSVIQFIAWKPKPLSFESWLFIGIAVAVYVLTFLRPFFKDSN